MYKCKEKNNNASSNTLAASIQEIHWLEVP